MSYYYFQISGEAGTLDIDTEAIEIIMPAAVRDYEKIQLARDSAYIKGRGNFIPDQIQLVKKFTKGSSNTAFNSLRAAVLQWMAVPRYKTLYFYIVTGDGDTLRTRVVPYSTSGESYSTLNISSQTTLTFWMIDGYFENTTATTTSKTLTTDSLEVMSVVNDGVLSAPGIYTLTLTATCDLFQVEIGDGYGFTLEKTSWSSGDVLSYNCADGVFTVNGNTETGYLTDGSIFSLSPGTNTLYIYGAAGELEVSINERYI